MFLDRKARAHSSLIWFSLWAIPLDIKFADLEEGFSVIRLVPWVGLDVSRYACYRENVFGEERGQKASIKPS